MVWWTKDSVRVVNDRLDPIHHSYSGDQQLSSICYLTYIQDVVQNIIIFQQFRFLLKWHQSPFLLLCVLQNRDGGWKSMHLSQTSSRPFCLFKWVQMPAADSCLMEASDNGRQRSREMSGRLGGVREGDEGAQGAQAPMRPAHISVRQLHTACPPGAPPAPQLVQRAAALGTYGEAIPPTHTWKSHTHALECVTG